MGIICPPPPGLQQACYLPKRMSIYQNFIDDGTVYELHFKSKYIRSMYVFLVKSQINKLIFIFSDFHLTYLLNFQIHGKFVFYISTSVRMKLTYVFLVNKVEFIRNGCILLISNKKVGFNHFRDKKNSKENHEKAPIISNATTYRPKI